MSVLEPTRRQFIQTGALAAELQRIAPESEMIIVFGASAVTDADDVSLIVECEDCGISYSVESDGLNDAGVEYWPAIMAEMQGGL